MHISEKLPLKIQTVEDIDVKMTQNDLEGNRDRKKSVKTLFCVYDCECVCTRLLIPQLHVHGNIATKN